MTPPAPFSAARWTLLCAALLAVGCEASFDEVDAIDLLGPPCDEAIEPAFVSLRVRLTQGEAPVVEQTVQASSSHPERMLLVPGPSIEAILTPDTPNWAGLDYGTAIYARFTGAVVNDRGALVTNKLGVVDPWLFVDLPGFCDEGGGPSEAWVQLDWQDASRRIPVRFGGRP